MRTGLGYRSGRRKLLASVLRYVTLGALGAAGGAAFSKRRRLVREDTCINQGVCRGCEVFRECGLPEALSAKEVLARKDYGRKQ